MHSATLAVIIFTVQVLWPVAREFLEMNGELFGNSRYLLRQINVSLDKKCHGIVTILLIDFLIIKIAIVSGSRHNRQDVKNLYNT